MQMECDLIVTQQQDRVLLYPKSDTGHVWIAKGGIGGTFESDIDLIRAVATVAWKQGLKVLIEPVNPKVDQSTAPDRRVGESQINVLANLLGIDRDKCLAYVAIFEAEGLLNINRFLNVEDLRMIADFQAKSYPILT